MRNRMPIHPGAKKPKHKGGRRYPMNDDPHYRAYVREFPCAAQRVLYNLTQQEIAEQGLWPCRYFPGRPRNEAAHVLGTKGAGNVHDRDSVCSLCPGHHDEQEGRTPRFERLYGIDFAVIVAELRGPYEKVYPRTAPEVLADDDEPPCDVDGVVASEPQT